MAADETVMGMLHTLVATQLAEMLKGTSYVSVDEDGVETTTVVPPSAAVLQAATKFLKDNSITCVASKDNALGELEAGMAARRAKREASKLDLANATESMSFTSGLQ